MVRKDESEQLVDHFVNIENFVAIINMEMIFNIPSREFMARTQSTWQMLNLPLSFSFTRSPFYWNLSPGLCLCGHRDIEKVEFQWESWHNIIQVRSYPSLIPKHHHGPWSKYWVWTRRGIIQKNSFGPKWCIILLNVWLSTPNISPILITHSFSSSTNPK